MDKVEIKEFLNDIEHEDTLLIIEVGVLNEDIVMVVNNDLNDRETYFLTVSVGDMSKEKVDELYEYLKEIKKKTTGLTVEDCVNN